MSDKDKTLKNQIDGVLDETTQAIMDEINQKMQATDSSDNASPVEEQTESVLQDAVDDMTADSSAGEQVEPEEETMESEEENMESEEEAMEDTPLTDEDASDDYEEPYEQEVEEEYMTRKERKEAKRQAKEAAKKAELEAKIEAEAAKRDDPNRASAGLRGFGIFTIFMFIITTALGVFLIWYLILSPAYIKDSSKKDFDFPEISSASDASAWEELTPLGYESEATLTDADIATSSDAAEEPSEAVSEDAE